MDFLLDIGNTRIKWAYYNPEKGLVRSGAIEHGNGRSIDDLFQTWHQMTRPNRVYAVNVTGPRIRKFITEWIQSNWKLNIHFLETTRYCMGITNGYENHNQLGIDRWAAILGVRDSYQKAYCVIDCGTAITIDAITSDGTHQGGIIVPGLSLMQKSLITKTKKIAYNSKEVTNIFPPKNTTDAAFLGSQYAAASVIDRFLEETEEQFNTKVEGFITGGDASTIQPLLRKTYRYDPTLVLKGITIMIKELT